MVLHKRLDYGSSGHQVPKMPHVPRSAKGKRSIRKKTEDNKTCAIDLLAAVAGQLLLERENSLNPFKTAGASSPSCGNDSVRREQLEKGLPYKAQLFDDTGSNKSRLGCKDAFQMQADYIAREHTSQTTNATSGHSSAFFIKSNASEKEAFGGNSSGNGTSGELGNSTGTILEKQSFESWSPGSTESCKYKLQDEIKTPVKAERRMAGNVIDGIDPGMCSFEDPMDMDTKPPALVSSDSSAEVPHGGVPIAHSSSFPKLRDATHLVNRDDDENSSGCTHPSTTTCKAYRPQRTEQRRIRKMSTSKYWKVAQSVLKDGDLSESEMNPVYRNRKLCYTRQRTQRCSFKRRKLLERCRISTSDAAVYAEGTSSKPLNGHIKVEARESNGTMHGADQPLSFAADGKTCYGSGDCHVKFSIKSFKMPELFVEIPENATVGSLKRTVAEAVTALLGGGLRVGVLLQGKKVRDDNKSLCQAGICHGEQLDNLGFTLEPNPTQAPSPLQSSEEPHSLLPLVATDVTEPLISRAPVAVTADDNGASNATLQLPLTTIVNCPESDHDSVQSPTDLPSPDKAAANSKALVPVPAMSLEALAVVPLCKSRRSELVQRRIRRPFSVMEVEALVQAVEKLGTGRWRDVKIRAFDNAKHRTYVDLKDKWKTLVHTARISPQQRRGEPVPQELLDRVLAAHAYWSQQQAKLQVKQPAAEACLLI